MKLLQVGRNLSGESFYSAFLKIRKFLTNQNLEGLYVFSECSFHTHIFFPNIASCKGVEFHLFPSLIF